jgi:hypothetical protein
MHEPRTGAGEARTWFERAVAEMQQGDIHGRIDQESLNLSREALSKIAKE